MKARKGFSAFELLVGTFVIIMITIISVPLITNYQKTTKLRSEARELATNLRLTQQLAITEQAVYNLKIADGFDSYSIVKSTNGELIKEIFFDPEVNIATTTGFTTSSIQFNGAGGVLEAGSVILINTKNASSTVEIKPSGYVQVSD